MRIARIRGDGDAYYHCMSRAIERRFIFGGTEKEKFRDIMRRFQIFCGIEILTHVIMDNHFHILLRVPTPRDVSDNELITRMTAIYEHWFVKQIERKLADLRKTGQHTAAEALKATYTYRMYDVSEFFKGVKQSFSQWYNRRNDRVGPLWVQRFKSILVEGTDNALFTIAAYIDLNPIRAGIVSQPEDYRYSGYGEAMGGSSVARVGIRQVIRTISDEASWARTRCLYRKHLYVQGLKKTTNCRGGIVLRGGFTKEQVEQVLATGGQLPMRVLLRCRVRYFSDGLALGSRAFIEELFDQHREQFGRIRSSGARPMKHGQWDGLCTLRDLRLNPVSAP